MSPDNQAKTNTKKAPARKSTTKKAPAKTRGEPRRPAPDHEAIAKRAHELYEAQGGGDAVAHWLQAERDLSLR